MMILDWIIILYYCIKMFCLCFCRIEQNILKTLLYGSFKLNPSIRKLPSNSFRFGTVCKVRMSAEFGTALSPGQRGESFIYCIQRQHFIPSMLFTIYKTSSTGIKHLKVQKILFLKRIGLTNANDIIKPFISYY